MKLASSIKRAVLWFQIRSIETHIDGIEKSLGTVSCKITLGNMQESLDLARAELARLRGEYNATLPPGQRVTWRTA